MDAPSTSSATKAAVVDRAGMVAVPSDRLEADAVTNFVADQQYETMPLAWRRSARDQQLAADARLRNGNSTVSG
jgi:hypothetical protein